MMVSQHGTTKTPYSPTLLDFRGSEGADGTNINVVTPTVGGGLPVFVSATGGSVNPKIVTYSGNIMPESDNGMGLQDISYRVPLTRDSLAAKLLYIEFTQQVNGSDAWAANRLAFTLSSGLYVTVGARGHSTDTCSLYANSQLRVLSSLNAAPRRFRLVLNSAAKTITFYVAQSPFTSWSNLGTYTHSVALGYIPKNNLNIWQTAYGGINAPNTAMTQARDYKIYEVQA